MRHVLRIVAMFLICALPVEAPSVSASGGGFTLVKSTLSGGGGTGSGGDFVSRSTTSQPDAGEASGGEFELSGSFALGDPADCAALSTAMGLTSSDDLCNAVRVEWIDVSAHETGYRVLRDGEEIVLTAANATAFDDTTAVPGTSYTYVVVTTNACGDADPSLPDIGHRALEPVAPVGLAIDDYQFSGVDSIEVSLSWTDLASDEHSQTIYLVDSTFTAVGSFPPDVEAAAVTIANSGPMEYCFAVAAQNCEIVALSDTACVDVADVADLWVAPVPLAFRLGPVSPNPFGSNVQIGFDVPHDTEASLRIFDVTGRTVRALRSGRVGAGRHALSWDGRNDRRTIVPSGVYYVEMRAPGFRRVASITLLR